VRRLLLLVSVIVLVDTVFYAAIAPLVPYYVDTLGLSKTAAGVLTAAYAAGTLVGSVPCGLLAARIGPRATVLIGLGLMAVSSLAFGFGESELVLDSARFVQGLGGACSWCGGMAWLLAAAPPSRRGQLIGTALGAAIVGGLLGPVVGAVARETSTEAVFSSVVVLAVGLAVAALATPAPPVTERQGLAALRRAVRARPVLVATWLVALPALAFGTLNVLGPLRLDAFGAGGTAIALTYLVAAGFEAVVSPLVGAYSDRRGRLAPIKAGLLAAAALLPFFVLPESAPALAGVLVVIAGTLGMFWAPAMAMLADAAEHQGLHLGLGFALVNLAWAGGQVVGASGGGALAERTADVVPLVVASVLLAATFGLLARRRAQTG
jgi:MFS family permease